MKNLPQWTHRSYNVRLMPTHFLRIIALLSALSVNGRAADKVVKNSESAPPVLWRNPPDISTRNLFYGPGGEKDQPHGNFSFVSEDLNGTNPKIVARDADGVKWTVKLGAEARPETAATRLTWALGYFVNEDYFVSDLKVSGMPRRLRRGQSLIAPDGSLPNVRLKRHLAGEKKAENWLWRQNDFTGTREFNGLRVMMALLNNWDLTDENNAIYSAENDQATGTAEQIYMVSDLGSTFGTGNLTWPMRNARGNLRAYRNSKFITKVGPDYVDFHAPARTSLFFLATPREYFSKFKLRWIGKHVPREDAKWLGQLLARLSPDQIRDAFRAAGYSPEEVEGFAEVVQHRITQLEDL
jgi:hypothetical protein